MMRDEWYILLFAFGMMLLGAVSAWAVRGWWCLV